MNELQYRFMFPRPNNKVMTTALTRCYDEKKQYSGRRTAAVSMNQTSVAAADYSSTSARHGEATWVVAGSPGAWDEKIITSR